MRELKNNLTLNVPVQTAFDWFLNLEKNYLQWHPKTHEKFEWLTDKPVQLGSIFYVEETIDGHSHKMILKITEYIKNVKLTFTSIQLIDNSTKFKRLVISIVSRVFKVKIQMERIFESSPDMQSNIHLTHLLGSELPLLGCLIDTFIEHFIFSLEDHKRHVIEEGEYMKRCLEG